ncbi:sel1 repeat family protein [Bradyrhizobium sediminis]|uniref:Sel1 repeat family protein n=1 Tax=Bradyrhizobium sediminis TaxID=2840469 RepID=A0A975NCZ6_9BRAD|nr:tetratricopeptide repeat protein [Bradyrhizobium sediminis]QWG12219.1 sel1 repeat family protein [Bradyrhizobium sediminis]
MTRAFRKIFAIIILSWSFSAIADAGPFEDAGAAYDGGDYATALRLYRQMADQGNGNAQFSLGTIYEKGRGVAQDDAEAAKWYRLAADQGHPTAQFNLGIMYDNGRGVAQNKVLAHAWFSLSVAQGNQEAARTRDILARRMTPTQLAQAQKLAREWKPEQQPHRR